MASITAHQLLFSRVESAAFNDIPHANIKRSGYQVVYHSQAIADDVSFIEKRVQCFQPKDDKAERFQFFSTDTGKIVVSQSVKIVADPVITDHNERDGAFIAHCYVFTRGEFAKIGNDPFYLIYDEDANIRGQQGRIFIDNPQDMLEVVRQKQEIVELTVRRRSSASSGLGSNRKEFTNLIRFAQGGLGDNTLAFMGDHREIEDILENLITLTDRRQRTKISFDTIIDNCNPPPGTYFAVGTSRRVPNSRFVNIDLNNPKIPTGKDDQKKTGYSNWLNSSLESTETLENILTRANTVQIINLSFEEQALLDEGLDITAVLEFIKTNQNLIHSRFKDALATEFSSDIAALIYDDVVSEKSTLTKVDIIDIATQTKFKKPQLIQALAEAAYQTLISHYPEKLNKNDISTIAKLGEATNDLRLQAFATINEMHNTGILSSVFGGKKKIEEKRDLLVQKLEKEKILEDVATDLSGFDWGKAIYFINEATAPTLINHVQQRDIDEQDLCDFIIAVIDAGGGKHLGQLQDKVSKLNDKSLKRLQKSIQKSKNKVDKKFEALINQQ